MTEISIQVLGSSKNAFSCEYIEVIPTDLFTQSFNVKRGKIELNNWLGSGAYLKND